MGQTISAIAPALGPIGTAVSIVSGVKGMMDSRKQEKDAKKTAAANTRAANEQAMREEAERNKRASRQPNVAAMASANANIGKQSTLLTSPTGVDPRSLTLGRTRMLGG